MDSTAGGPGATRPGEGGGRLISERGLMSERGVCERGREVEEGATARVGGIYSNAGRSCCGLGPRP